MSKRKAASTKKKSTETKLTRPRRALRDRSTNVPPPSSAEGSPVKNRKASNIKEPKKRRGASAAPAKGKKGKGRSNPAVSDEEEENEKEEAESSSSEQEDDQSDNDEEFEEEQPKRKRGGTKASPKTKPNQRQRPKKETIARRSGRARPQSYKEEGDSTTAEESDDDASEVEEANDDPATVSTGYASSKRIKSILDSIDVGSDWRTQGAIDY